MEVTMKTVRELLLVVGTLVACGLIGVIVFHDNKQLIESQTSFLTTYEPKVSITIESDEFEIFSSYYVEELSSVELTSTTEARTQLTTKKPVQTSTTKTNTTTPNVSETTKKRTATIKEYVKGKNEYEVPDIPDFKSWTNYLKSVNRSSGQWKFLNSEGTWTDENGFRRKNNDYMVAMGSYYTHTLGDRFKITTTNGSFTVSICDFKADSHTDSKHQYSTANHCITEFYVGDNLNPKVRRSGSASSINELSGKIIKIEKL
jgi:hypothetical protein